MPVNNTTSNRGYQLPHATNFLDEDVARLIAALGAIDNDMAAVMAGLLARAAATHGHVINDVAGLQAALDAKMSASVQLALAALSDVDLTGAAAGMFLRLIGNKWSPIAFDASMIASGTVPEARLPAGLAATALAAAFAPLSHTHPPSQISGLPAPSGTRMLFQQTTAPTGWTKDANPGYNHSLRVTGGAAGYGGSLAFTAVFADRGIAGVTNSVAAGGSVGDTTLSTAQMPWHQHAFVEIGGNGGSGSGEAYKDGPYRLRTYSRVTDGAGLSLAHGHSFTGSAHSHSVSASLNMSVAYVDVIIAQKD